MVVLAQLHRHFLTRSQIGHLLSKSSFLRRHFHQPFAGEQCRHAGFIAASASAGSLMPSLIWFVTVSLTSILNQLRVRSHLPQTITGIIADVATVISGNTCFTSAL